MQFITASVQTLQWFVAYYISMGLINRYPTDYGSLAAVEQI
jgi:hypothetical protein